MPEHYQYNLEIAEIPICMQTNEPLSWEEAFLPFKSVGKSPRYTVNFRRVDTLPTIPEQILWEGHCDRIHPDGAGGYLRSFFDAPRSTQAYAVGTYDYAGGKIVIDYLEQGRNCVSEMSNSFFHLGIERLLLQEQKFCLHAACVQTDLGGILFSGPSGIGKSTQADLWCQFRNSRMINGDRPILGRKEQIWTAWGSPYAGSSRCYVNQSCPISAIIMLEPWGPCRIRRIPLSEGFRRIYNGLTMYSWDAAFMTEAFDFAVALATEIPVYAFSCTPDEAAVDFLEKVLRKDLGL